ncbi:6560_t:CDS:1, partial [Cetraspora pellucida]
IIYNKDFRREYINSRLNKNTAFYIDNQRQILYTRNKVSAFENQL